MLEGREANTGIVPEWIVWIAVNDMQPKFPGTAGIRAFPHAFPRESTLLAEQRGLVSPLSTLFALRPLGSTASPPPHHFLSLSLSFQGDDTFPPGRLPGPHSSFSMLVLGGAGRGSLADVHLEKTGGDSRPPGPQWGQGGEMMICKDFQLRPGLGEGVVVGIKPTPQPVQRPGKKCSRTESLSKQASACVTHILSLSLSLTHTHTHTRTPFS